MKVRKRVPDKRKKAVQTEQPEPIRQIKTHPESVSISGRTYLHEERPDAGKKPIRGS